MSLPKDSIQSVSVPLTLVPFRAFALKGCLDNFIVENNLTVKAVKSLVKKQNVATVKIGDQKYASKASLEAAFALEFEAGIKKAQERKQFAADKAKYNDLVYKSFETVLSEPKKAEEVTKYYRSAANQQTALKIQYSKQKLATLKRLQKELEFDLAKLKADADGVDAAKAALAPAAPPATS